MQHRPMGFMTTTPKLEAEPTLDFDIERMKKALASPRTVAPRGLSIEELDQWYTERAALRSSQRKHSTTA